MTTYAESVSSCLFGKMLLSHASAVDKWGIKVRYWWRRRLSLCITIVGVTITNSRW